MDYVLQEAQKLLQEFCTSNPRELAEYLNIKVIKYPLTKLYGIYLKVEEYKFAVINSNLSIEEQKYTLLHEIAHARLHHDNNYFAINENQLVVTGKYERQADLFAAAIFLKENPDDCKSRIGNQLLQKTSELYLKKIFSD